MSIIIEKVKIKKIFIIGANSSGTSMVSRVLKEIGIPMGDEKDNTKQYLNKEIIGKFFTCEDQELCKINQNAIEKVLKTNWLSITYTDWMKLIGNKEFDIKMLNYIRMRNGNAPDRIWGAKDPRMTMLFPLWMSRAQNMKVILCYRDPGAISSSLLKKNGIGYPISMKMIFNNYTMLKQIKSFMKASALEVNYDGAIIDPKGFVNDLLNFIKVEIPEEKKQRAINVINSNLNNNKEKFYE